MQKDEKAIKKYKFYRGNGGDACRMYGSGTRLYYFPL